MFRLSNLPCPLDQALEPKALIARALGLPLGRIARARLALRKALESEGNLLDGIASVRGKGP